MNLYLCDITALRFWRQWSQERPISVRAFHERDERATADLPFRLFPSTTVLGPSIASRGALERTAAALPEHSTEVRIVDRLIREALSLHDGRPRAGESVGDEVAGARVGNEGSETTADDAGAVYGAGKVAAGSADARAAREAGDAAVAVRRDGRLHVMGPTKHGAAPPAFIRYHHSCARYPRGSFLKVAPAVYVAAPELVFVSMAGGLSFGELVALGYELCGAYPLDRPRNGFVRRPLCSAARLVSFVGQLHRVKGVAAARRAAPFVRSKSASFMESEVCAAALLPRRCGGFNRSGVVLNRLVELSPKAAEVARHDGVTIDLLWPDLGLGLEYDSECCHSTARSMAWDSRKYDALALESIDLWRLTADQFANILEFQEVVRKAFGKHGHYVRALQPTEQARCLALRAEMRKYHREHFFTGR